MNVFVSYRHDDTKHFAGRLSERLKYERGITSVFLDVESVVAGENFVDRIQDALANCQAVLVVIGSDWQGARPERASRLFDDDDHVRVEVREALKSGARILPLLVDGAALPTPEQLPADLLPLRDLNTIAVRHAAFNRDVGQLVAALFEEHPTGGLRAFLRAHPGLAMVMETVAGAGLALLLLVVALAIANAMGAGPLEDFVGGPGMVILVTTMVAAVGAAVPHVLRRLGVLP